MKKASRDFVSKIAVLSSCYRPPRAPYTSVAAVVLVLGKYAGKLHMTNKRSHCNNHKSSASFSHTLRKVVVSAKGELTTGSALVQTWV